MTANRGIFMYAPNCNVDVDFFAAGIFPLFTGPWWISAVYRA